MHPEIPSSSDRPRGAELRQLKGRAQLLEPVVKVGKAGLSPEFFTALDEALTRHELVKVKFEHHKDQKKALAPEMAIRTDSHLIQRVGNVAILYRRRPPLSE
ncbi:MAG: YhbY family RNA-binding protein [Verrucomicrobiales bacterium]|nr:YhbY family RNA-binding protein [Verrucomicrobiales bacterium]